MRYFFFNGYYSYEMGLIVEDKNIWGGPQPDFELISVPGRDGDVVLDHGRYKNVEVNYTVSFIGTKEKAAALRQWLCARADYGYFYAKKQCPQYILPHWNTFLSTVQKYYNVLTGKAITPKTETAGRTYTVGHGDTLWQIAQTLLGKGSRYPEIVKLNGLKRNVLYTGQVLTLPEK